MKGFFKTLLASFLGVIISFFLIFIISIMIVGGMAASLNKPVQIKGHSVLFLQLDKQIIDRQPASTINIGQYGVDTRIGLNRILSAIEHAKTDSRIDGIYIESAITSAGYETIDEIRNALIDFRTSGKFVVSYSDIYTQKTYYAATAGDKIFYNPNGLFMLNGLKIKAQFYKNTFKKLGIEPVVVKMGKYKSATEQFVNDKMSRPNKEQLTALIGSMWNSITGKIAEARGISVDTLNFLINNLTVDLPENLTKYNLVDSLVYKSDVLAYLKKLTSTPQSKNINGIKLSDYSNVISQSRLNFSSSKIAVIYASGVIYDGEADGDNIGGERFARAFRAARRDSSVKAIVLRVDSPGGSSLASEIILDEIRRTKGIKPVIVSMGDLAASGGYYISCDADSIIAGENSITGSIGVFFRAAYSNGFFNKLGITFDEVKTNKHADMFSFTRPYSNDELAYLQNRIGQTYNVFLSRVSEGRNMPVGAVNEIAQGRVWSGYDAKKVGLVDSFGGLREAIAAANKMAGLNGDYQILELPKQVSPFEKLVKDLSGDSKIKKSLQDMGIDSQTFDQIKQMMKVQGIVSIVPYNLEVD